MDPWDSVPANGGIHTDISLAVDADGIPAVTYWKSRQELWYAARTGAGGAWTRSRIATRPNVNVSRAAQVDFDANGGPVIAYYDQPSNRVLLARPIPPDVIIPVDLALTGRGSPAATTPGSLVTYTLTVTNQGTTIVSSPTLDVRLPDGAAFLSAAPAQTSPGRWTLGPLSPGTSTSVSLTIKAPATEGDAILVASASSREPEGDPADNTVALGTRVQGAACFMPTAGLAALFRGDGSTDNEIAGQADGLAAGGLAYTAGAIGDGFLLNGTDAAVVADPPDDNAFYPVNGSFTVQAWVRTTSPLVSVIAARHECVSYNCGQTAWLFQMSNGVPLIFLRNNVGATQTLAASRAIHDGALHHVAFTIDRAAGELRLYIDGVREATAPYTLGEISNSNFFRTPLVIGAYETFNLTRDRFFTGVIDELSIAKRAFSDAELAGIAALAGAPLCGPVPTSGTDVAASITAVPLEAALSTPVQYVLRATNTGTTTATDVTLTHTLPAGAALVDSAPAATGSAAGSQVFTIGTLPPGASAWAVVRTTAPPSPGPAVSTAVVNTPGDAVPANDAAAVTVLVTRGACTLVPLGLVAHWRANGTTVDAAGGHNGLVRGTMEYLPSLVGAGLAFGFRGDGFVEVRDKPALRPAAFTLGAWVAPDFIEQVGVHAVVSKGRSGTDPRLPAGAFSYWLGFENGVPTFSTWQSTGAVTLQGSQSLPGGDWYHLAVTYDGAMLRLYVNGDEVDARALAEPIIYDTGEAPLLIGDATSDAGSHRFRGLIDDVTLHGRALTVADLQALVAGPSAACLVNTPPTVTPVADARSDRGEGAMFSVDASDAEGDPLTFAASGLPPGLDIDPALGVISGAPTEAGVFPVVVRVTDGIAVVEVPFTWTIVGNSPPDIGVAANPPTNAEGNVVSRARDTLVTAVDVDGDPVTFAFSGLPPDVTYDPVTDRFAGTIPAGAAGSYDVAVTADDGRGGVSQATFVWTITAPQTVTIDIVEHLVVSDAVAVTPAVLIDIVEPLTVTDTVEVTPAVMIEIAEPIAVADLVAVTPAILIDIIEPLTVTDTVEVTPAVMIDIAEPIVVADAVRIERSVLIEVVESIAIEDAVGAQTSIRLAIVERISATDTPFPRPAIRLAIVERVGVADAPLARPPLRVVIAERIGVADSTAPRPSVRLAIVERVGVADAPGARPPLRIAIVERVGVRDVPFLAPPPSNRPPVARARGVVRPARDMCVASVPASAFDARSYDPDGDPITLSVSPAGPYPLGATTVTLTVTDAHGASSSATTTVQIDDRTAPSVSAALRRVAQSGPTTGIFEGRASASDACDPAPLVRPVMRTPVGQGFDLTVAGQGNAAGRTIISIDLLAHRIRGRGTRAEVEYWLATMAREGGVPVVSGQTLDIQVGGLRNVELAFRNGVLVSIRVPDPRLLVRATDRTGNTRTATATPRFR